MRFIPGCALPSVDFSLRIPIGVLPLLARDVAAKVNKGQFEQVGQIITEALDIAPPETILERLMTGFSLANPSAVDVGRTRDCLRYFRPAGIEAEAAPDAILLVPTWGAVEWPEEERKAYFVEGLGRFFAGELLRKKLPLIYRQFLWMAELLKTIPDADFWRFNYTLAPGDMEALVIYDTARRKGATKAEIRQMADVIMSVVKERHPELWLSRLLSLRGKLDQLRRAADDAPSLSELARESIASELGEELPTVLLELIDWAGSPERHLHDRFKDLTIMAKVLTSDALKNMSSIPKRRCFNRLFELADQITNHQWRSNTFRELAYIFSGLS